MHSETLDFEEPIVVLLKEIQALSLLPRTAERQREIEQLRARVETVRREIYSPPHTLAAGAGRSTPEPAEHA